MKALLILCLTICVVFGQIEIKRRYPAVSNSLGKFVLNNGQDFEYSANVTLGTPPQKLEFIFDTGSDFLWVNAISGKYN